MKPILIIRFVAHEGPGYFGTFLDEQAIAHQLLAIDKGDAVPKTVHQYSGLVLMGGPMSANDDLPWVPAVLHLIQEADAADIPLLGHCLGGQLISKALGAEVRSNPVKEIGWGPVQVAKSALAESWFGPIETFNAFHWHGETFDMPEGAERILSSAYCENQAYALGKHLVLQTHVEVLPAMIVSWCEEGVEELASVSQSPAVQLANEMQEDATLHCFFLHKVASQLYGQWLKNLVS